MTIGTIAWLIDTTLNHRRHQERVSAWSDEHLRSMKRAWAWWADFAAAEGQEETPLSDPFWSPATLSDALACPSLAGKTATRRIYRAGFQSLAKTALIEGVILHSPAAHVTLPTSSTRFFAYTDDEVDRLIASAAALGHRQRTAAMMRLLAIMADLGQRQGDSLALSYGAHYRDGSFMFRQNKTQRPLLIPATDRLLHILGPGANRIGPIVNWTGSMTALREGFAKVRDAAGLPADAKMMHLRHYAVMRMARLGFNALQISTVSGHTAKSVDAMLQRHYFARDGEVAASVISRINAAS